MYQCLHVDAYAYTNKDGCVMQQNALLDMYFVPQGNEVKLWTCTPECRERGM